MTGVHVRGACPSLPAPMETGDGLLVRLVVNAPIPLDDFIGLCAASRTHGNGTMEVSGRGSIQVRGLTPLSAPRFAAALAALAIDIDDGVPVLADPLPDDPASLIDANRLAGELRAAIAGARLALAPKVSVVVDGGGRIDLDAVAADIRLRAIMSDEGPKFELALAGNADTALPIATIAVEDAIGEVLTLLRAIAALGEDARANELAISRTLHPRLAPRQSQRAHPIGRHPLNGQLFALGLGLAFGHADAGALIELADIAKGNGARCVRPAPDRALLFGPLGEGGAETLRVAAARLGFITDASDPRRRIAACPGAPFCAHGLIAARAFAAEIAQQLSLPGDGIAVHVSGCAKGCAHPKRAPLTIVGTEHGCGVVRGGSARDRPTAYADPADLAALLDRIAARETVHA
ncbi:MAG TPA: precorrin-3B synthase [Methyloceanibacter sp.]|nr:precorrin-3B synthase [Methyloceanibacter sp.]